MNEARQRTGYPPTPLSLELQPLESGVTPVLRTTRRDLTGQRGDGLIRISTTVHSRRFAVAIHLALCVCVTFHETSRAYLFPEIGAFHAQTYPGISGISRHILGLAPTLSLNDLVKRRVREGYAISRNKSDIWRTSHAHARLLMR